MLFKKKEDMPDFVSEVSDERGANVANGLDSYQKMRGWAGCVAAGASG